MTQSSDEIFRAFLLFVLTYSMSAAKVVACGIEATIELKAGKGSTRKSKFIGLALVDGTLKIAFGRGSDALHFALTSIQNVVANKMKEGYATFILGVARHEPQQLFVSKSEPVQLERLLEAMNEAVGVTRRGKAPMPQGDAAALCAAGPRHHRRTAHTCPPNRALTSSPVVVCTGSSASSPSSSRSSSKR
tara:strand:- start:1148 stop:1717 length:570 start_codon:yes stop_codon:yes gene_type:complete